MAQVQTLATQTTTAPAGEQKPMQWADFNTFSAEGRVAHAEIVENDGQQWLSVTVITTLKDGTDGISVQFTNANGILSLYRKGYLMKGRRVHVTGTVTEIATSYVNKDGVVVPLQRGRIRMQAVTLRLGATPKAAA